MYKLYGTRWSNPFRRVVSLLEQENIQYQIIEMDLASGEHRTPEFAALNPNLQIPVLDDEGFVLYESNTILRYLCNKHQLSHWYPESLQARALVDQWLDWSQCVMTTPVFNIVFHGVFAGDKGNKHLVELGMQKLPDIWQVLEQNFTKSPYVCGEQVCIADLAVFSNLFQLRFARIKPESEVINQWSEKMLTLPGVAKSLPPRK